jgi:hypothetical protein
MTALALPSSEHLALPQGAVMQQSTITHNKAGTLLGDVLTNGESALREGVGFVANGAGRLIRFTTDVTLTTIKNLCGGFLRRPHS